MDRPADAAAPELLGQERIPPMRVALWCTLLFLIGLVPVVWMTDQELRTNARERTRLEMNIRLERYSNAITAALNRRLTLLSALSTFAESRQFDGTGNRQYEIFAAGLFSTIDGLTAVRLIYDDEVHVIFPGNGSLRIPPPEHLTPDSARGRALEKALSSRRIVVVDPESSTTTTRQEITAYQTVFNPNGLVRTTIAITFELSPILREVGLESAPADLHLVLRTSFGRTFYGQPIVFALDPVVSEIDGVGYSWELAAMPRGGWDSTMTGEFRMLRAAGISITSLLAVLVYLIVGYQERLKSEVRHRTADLRAANEALLREAAERQRTLEELRETSFALSKAMPGIARLDPQSRFGHLNPDMAHMLGAKPDDVLGRPWQEFLHPAELPAAAAAYREMQEGGKAEFETRARRQDGREFYCQALLVRRDLEGGGFSGCHLFLRDISARKEREAKEKALYENLARAKRMESIGKLAGGVAHDLNNILGPLVAYPDLILDELPQDHPVRPDVISIREGSLNARRVIQDLLTLARRSRREHHPIDLNQIVGEYLESANFRELEAQHPDVDVRSSLDSDPLMVNGSKTQLHQVLMNLVTNAYEAMGSTGILTVRTGRHVLARDVASSHETEPGEHALLVVEDTGEGIEPSKVDQIYEPFYSTKEMDRSGTGLGLTVAYGVVRDHLGYIEVDSEPDQGARFLISLPTTEQEAASEPAIEDAAEAPRGSESILVVDDRETQRALATRLLTHLGYQVYSANHGRAAVTFLESQPVDLVILDMVMEPDFDGLDAFLAIRRRHPPQRCIIASGYSAGDRVKQALDMGALAYLAKPYTRKNIGFVVRQALDQAPTTQDDSTPGGKPVA